MTDAASEFLHKMVADIAAGKENRFDNTSHGVVPERVISELSSSGYIRPIPGGDIVGSFYVTKAGLDANSY